MTFEIYKKIFYLCLFSFGTEWCVVNKKYEQNIFQIKFHYMQVHVHTYSYMQGDFFNDRVQYS